MNSNPHELHAGVTIMSVGCETTSYGIDMINSRATTRYKQFVRMNFNDDSTRILHYKVLGDSQKMSILTFSHRETCYQPFRLHRLLGTQNTKMLAVLHSCIKLYAITLKQPTKANKHPNWLIQEAIARIR